MVLVTQVTNLIASVFGEIEIDSAFDEVESAIKRK